jgi:surface protein
MFSHCHELVGWIPTINFANASSAVSVFTHCKKIRSVNIKNTENVTSFNNAFSNCHKLLNVEGLDTRSVTDFANMFYGCSLLSIDLDMDVSNGVNFSRFLVNTRSLVKIENKNFINGENFIRFANPSGVMSVEGCKFRPTEASSMFKGCWRLKTFGPNQFDEATTGGYSSAFDGCNLDQASVDNIIKSIAKSAGYEDERSDPSKATIENGVLGLSGSNNSPPSQNLAELTYLIGAGWTVDVEGETY